MTTRAAKQLLRNVMRAAKTAEELQSSVLLHLNLLLGAESTPAHRVYWEVVMRLELKAKFSLDLEDKARDSDRGQLFQRLSTLLGISFGPAFVFLPSAPFPFEGKTLLLDARVKILIRHAMERGFSMLLQSGALSIDSLCALLESINHAQEQQACALQLANELYRAKRLSEARGHLVAIMSFAKAPISLELRLAASLLLSRVLRDLGAPTGPLSAIGTPTATHTYTRTRHAFAPHLNLV
jgi:hypothetical protein